MIEKIQAIMKLEELINYVNWKMILEDNFPADLSDDIEIMAKKSFNINSKVTIDHNKNNLHSFIFQLNDYNENTFKTFNGFKPKTRILYSNYCELELLRIYYLNHNGTGDLAYTFEHTRERLKTTCFGRFCPTGECFEISVATMRFIATVFSKETAWTNMYIEEITKTILNVQKKISYQTKMYFLQSLLEIGTSESNKAMVDLRDIISQYVNRFTKENTEYDRINRKIVCDCMQYLELKC